MKSPKPTQGPSGPASILAKVMQAQAKTAPTRKLRRMKEELAEKLLDATTPNMTATRQEEFSAEQIEPPRGTLEWFDWVEGSTSRHLQAKRLASSGLFNVEPDADNKPRSVKEELAEKLLGAADEIESARQDKREVDALARKAFAKKS